MANNPTGLLPVLASMLVVVASIPAALAAIALARFTDSFWDALQRVAVTFVGLVLAVATLLAVLVGPTVAAVTAVTVFAAAVVLAAFPLYIGAQLVDRWTDCGMDDALRYATLGLPVALVASYVVFVAPGGAARDTLTVGTGVVATLHLLAVFLVVTLGPAVAGLGYARVFETFG